MTLTPSVVRTLPDRKPKFSVPRCSELLIFANNNDNKKQKKTPTQHTCFVRLFPHETISSPSSSSLLAAPRRGCRHRHNPPMAIAIRRGRFASCPNFQSPPPPFGLQTRGTQYWVVSPWEIRQRFSRAISRPHIFFFGRGYGGDVIVDRLILMGPIFALKSLAF